MIKILIVLTSTGFYSSGDLKTGLWLSEITHFYDSAKEMNYDITLASPDGGKTPIDPESLKPMVLDKLTKQYLHNVDFINLLNSTVSLKEIKNEKYDCLYLTGGHGTMYDFPNNEILQDIIKSHYESGKIVSAVCHGVAGLLNVKLTDNSYLINGKHLTGYTWFEEILARRNKEVPFNLQAEIKKRNGKYTSSFLPLTSKVVIDKNLITGQNPFSSKKIAKVVMHELKNSSKF